MNDVTHLGIYDIPMMANIPNLVYLAPTTKEEYMAMLDWSVEQNNVPVAIRVPMQVVTSGVPCTKDFSQYNTYEVTQKGVQPTVINPMYITGVDEELLESLKAEHDIVITVEDGILDGGFGEKIARFYGRSDMKVLNYGLKKEFLDRYDAEDVVKRNRLTAGQIAEDVIALL